VQITIAVAHGALSRAVRPQIAGASVWVMSFTQAAMKKRNKMTTLKKMGFFDGIHYMWVHSLPHTKRVRSRLALGAAVAFAVRFIAEGLHLPGWLALILSMPAIVYMLWEFLIFMGADLSWEAQQKDEKLICRGPKEVTSVKVYH